jgi:hypothetical protein
VSINQECIDLMGEVARLKAKLELVEAARAGAVEAGLQVLQQKMELEEYVTLHKCAEQAAGFIVNVIDFCDRHVCAEACATSCPKTVLEDALRYAPDAGRDLLRDYEALRALESAVRIEGMVIGGTMAALNAVDEMRRKR